MMRRKTIWIVAIILALAGGLLRASYLENDYPEETAPRRTVPPPPRRIIPPAPRPVRSNPLTEMVGRLTVREGYHYRGLTVFPIELARVTEPTVYLSAEEALANGMLTVREKGSGVVPSIIVANRGREPILMLGGELLLGGKQNRVLRDDVLLPARSGPVEVPVLCIEQGRWSGRTATFESRRSVAPLGVRGRAQAGRPQAEIWEGVSLYQRSFRVESKTADLQAVHDLPEVRKSLEEYRANFAKRCWRPEQVGMVVARYGRIVGADVFGNAAMFRKHRDRLLESYAVDCIAYGRRGRELRRKAPGRSMAERFLRRVFRARYSWRATPGLGRLLSVSGAGLSGSALVCKDNVLHTCLFPEAEVIVPIVRPPRPLPPPHPLPIPLPEE